MAETYAAFTSAHLGWTVDPAGVVPVTDVMVGVAEVLRVLTSPGAAVMVSPPVYPPFFSTIREVGRTVVEAPLRVVDGRYHLDLDALEHAFAAGAEAYLLCNPHNPVGRVWTADELQAVAALAERHGVHVIADEVHAPLVLVGARHQPWLDLGGYAAERGVAISAASKAWNLPGSSAPSGHRAGSDARSADGLPRICATGSVISACSRLTQPGARVSWLQSLLEVLDRNRRLVVELLQKHLPDLGFVPPEASYLAWLDCRRLGLGDNPAEAFLERGRVALYPGLAFGQNGAGFVRLNLGTSADLVGEAVSRMSAAVGAIAR